MTCKGWDAMNPKKNKETHLSNFDKWTKIDAQFKQNKPKAPLLSSIKM